MFNKCIRVDLPIVTVSINDVPEEAQKGFEVLTLLVVKLVEYMINHCAEFKHIYKYSDQIERKQVNENNVVLLKDRIYSGEAVLPGISGISSEVLMSLKKNCPFVVLESAVRISEEYLRLKREYNSSRSTMPKPVIPELRDCCNFKIQHISDLIQKQRIKFPFLVEEHLCCKEIDIPFLVDSSLNCKNINLDNSFVIFENGNYYIEIHPVKFIFKPNNYSLNDIKVMGVDLGTINDATCAIFNNLTGEVVCSQIYISEKEEIMRLQSQYKNTHNETDREEIVDQIKTLKDTYQRQLAEAICCLALDNRVEYVFFEGLYDQKCTSSALTLWNPRAVLEKVYAELHNSGIAYQSISPVYTSQYYANGGVVNRIANDRSKAFTPDGLLVDADKNAALNIVARGMIDMYFDTLPEECLLSIVRDNPRLLRCNEIIFEDLLNTRQLVNNEINTNTIFTRQRYFNKHKATFCKKYRLR